MSDFNYYDYASLMGMFIDNFKSDLNVDLIPENSSNEIPAYPFTTYNFIDPHVDVGYSTQNSKYFDMFIAFTTHTNSLEQTLTTSSKLLSWFKDSEVQYMLSQNGVRVIKVFNQTQLDNMFAFDADRRATFEVRLRVVGVDEREVAPTIDNVVANGDINIKRGN